MIAVIGLIIGIVLGVLLGPDSATCVAGPVPSSGRGRCRPDALFSAGRGWKDAC